MKKKKKEILDQIANLQEGRRSLIEKAKTEKRALTDEELRSFEESELEERKLEIELRELEVAGYSVPGKQEPEDGVDLRTLAVEAVSSGQMVDVSKRAAGTTMSTDVTAVIPDVFQEILGPLEKALVLDRIGVKMMTNVQGEPIWPIVAAVEASILGEGVEISDTKIAIDKIKADPKRVSIAIPITNRAINQANIDLKRVILERIGAAVGQLLNKWAFSKTKLAGASDGPMSIAFASAGTYAAAAGVTNKDVVNLEGTVLGKEVDPTGRSAAYVMGTKMYSALKSTPIEKGSPKMILENGVMNGYPAVVTNHMPDDALLFGVFDYTVMCQFGQTRLVIDPITKAKEDKTLFILNAEFDITVLRSEAFACLKKA